MPTIQFGKMNAMYRLVIQSSQRCDITIIINHNTKLKNVQNKPHAFGYFGSTQAKCCRDEFK